MSIKSKVFAITLCVTLVMLVLLLTCDLSSPWLLFVLVLLASTICALILLSHRGSQGYRQVQAAFEQLEKGQLASIELPEHRDEFRHIIRGLIRIHSRIDEDSREYSYLDDTLDAVEAAVIVTDEMGSIFSVNSSGERIFARNVSEMLGHSLFEMVSKKMEGSETSSSLDYSDPQRSPVEITFERAGQRRVGSLIWSRIDSYKTYGNEPLYVITISDITEKRQLEAKLLVAQKMEVLGKLSGGVAHDFNNILGAISSTVAVMNKQGVSAENQKRIDLINSCIERAAGMTKGLLSFARDGYYDTQRVVLGEVLEEAIRIVRINLKNANCLVLPEMDKDTLILGDRSQLVSVFMNLLSNACEAVEGLSDPRVTLAFASSHVALDGELQAVRYVQVIVADNGKGISKVEQDSIFEPFYTTKSSGTGLGLSMTLSVVRAHKGSISVNSSAQAGTTFTVSLPLCVSEDPIEHGSVSSSKDLGSLEGMICLLVDDDELVRSSTKLLLEQLGFIVHAASSGKDALALFNQYEDYDLVMSDAQMPEMSGIELVRQILERCKSQKVILYSGYAKMAEMRSLSSYMGVLFIQKGEGFEQLESTLRQLLR